LFAKDNTLLCYYDFMEKDESSYEKDDDKLEKKSKNKKESIKDSSQGSVSDREKDSDDVEKTKSSDSKGLSRFFDGLGIESNEIHENLDKDLNEIPNLSEEELLEATLAIVDARTQEVTEELATVEPDSQAEYEALADALFLESLQELAEGREDITRELINNALAEALEDLSLSEENIHNENVDDNNGTDNQVDTDLDDDNTPSAMSNVTSANVASGGQSPVPPISPVPLISSSPNISSPYSHYHTQQTRTVQSSNYNNAPVGTNEIHNHRSDMLVGAILGYILGRREGRKRTEKKLQPKIDNLEKQVAVLHDTILEKEVIIRKAVRENTNQPNTGNISVEKVMERRKTRKHVKETLKRHEELSKDPGVEKIGRFSLPALKVFHEKRLPDGSENSPKRKQVEVMTEAELLDKVAGLKIHGLDVATMYKRKRLTLDSLRQITKEYLRGGPFKQTFSLELLSDEREVAIKQQQVQQVHEKSQQVSNHDTRRFANNNTHIQETISLVSTPPTKQPVPDKNYTKIKVLYGVILGITVAFILLAIIQ
jgi:hypothetical protein